MVFTFFVGLMFSGLPGVAQTFLRGQVIDRETREPVSFATLTFGSAHPAILTDKDGRYATTIPGDSVSTTITAIGYRSITLRLHPATAIIPLSRGPVNMQQVTVFAPAGNGTFHILSNIDLNLHPTNSAQDLLRLVPGLFIAQHQGGGKAEQIFLRGFDADHGTDVNISVDGMPVNMVSQAHGQGYADMHFIIPETINSYDFGKGPYYSDKGDFTTAGYVAYHTKNVLPQDMVKIEGGRYNTLRAVALINLLPARHLNKGRSAYFAAEGLYSDGPFDYPEHFNRGNLFGKFITPLGEKNKLIASLSTLDSKWRASGEIPNRALAEGYIKDRFGVIDSAQGGNTTRTNAIAKLETRVNDCLSLENELYYSRYSFNLVSNFTFYYFYPQSGDEFRQYEQRNLYGYNGKLTYKNLLGDATLISTAGWSLRFDRISPSYLAHTMEGGPILNYIQLGNINETNVSEYLDESLQTGRWLFNAGVRADYFHFCYRNQAPASDTGAAVYAGVDPRAGKAILSPKINIQYAASPHTQLYLKLGKGFHSNDARIVIANRAHEILPAAFGADLGLNWKPVPRVYVNAALWYLYLQQEFTYGADLGDQSTLPGGRTEREGIDLSVRYQMTDWLFANANVDLARPRGLDAPRGENYLPLAPTLTSTGGLDVRFADGWNGGISYRYLHNRPAGEDNTLTALGYFVADMTINYTKKKYEIGLIVENLFNQTWDESQFEYISRLKNEIRPVDEVSYTPGTPFFARLKFIVFFG